MLKNFLFLSGNIAIRYGFVIFYLIGGIFKCIKSSNVFI